MPRDRQRVVEVDVSAGNIRRTDWGRIALAYLAGVACIVQLGLIAPMVPLLQRELGLSLPFVGAVLSAMTAVATIFGAVAGTATARLGLARSLKAGLLILAATAALGALVDDGASLLATRCLAGIGYIVAMVTAPALIARLAQPRDQPLALGFWSTFGPVGIASAEAAAQFLDPLGWRGLLWADAALLIALSVAMIAFMREVAVPAAGSIGSLAFWHLYRMRAPMLLCMAFVTFSFAFIVFAGLVPAYLVEARGFPAAQIGRLTGLAMLAGIPGAIGAGWLVRRGWSPHRLCVAALVLPALLSIAIFVPTPLAVTIGALAGTALLGGMMPAATYALVPRIEPDPHLFAPVNGLLTQLASLGVLAGPPLFAAWTDAVGWSLGPVLLIALALVGVGLLMAIGRHLTTAPA